MIGMMGAVIPTCSSNNFPNLYPILYLDGPWDSRFLVSNWGFVTPYIPIVIH